MGGAVEFDNKQAGKDIPVLQSAIKATPSLLVVIVVDGQDVLRLLVLRLLEEALVLVVVVQVHHVSLGSLTARLFRAASAEIMGVDVILNPVDQIRLLPRRRQAHDSQAGLEFVHLEFHSAGLELGDELVDGVEIDRDLLGLDNVFPVRRLDASRIDLVLRNLLAKVSDQVTDALERAQAKARSASIG